MTIIPRPDDLNKLLPLLFQTAVTERVSLDLDYTAGTYEEEGSYSVTISIQHTRITISDLSLASVCHLALSCLDELTKPTRKKEADG